MVLQSERAIIKDINIELINYYKVRKTVNELIKELKRHKNEKNYFYTIRAWDSNKDYKDKTLVQIASIIIFLNKTCFNGIYRVNC